MVLLDLVNHLEPMNFSVLDYLFILRQSCQKPGLIWEMKFSLLFLSSFCIFLFFYIIFDLVSQYC